MLIWLRKKIRETTPFTKATSNIKYLGVTQHKHTKDLYDKKFKCLKKDIENDIRRWEDPPYSWISKINIFRNGHLIKSNLQIQCNPH